MTVTRLVGDSRDVLATLPEKHFHCCVTSPPYFGLRNYGGGDREIGTETTLDCMAWATGAERCNACYVCSIMAVCDGVWQVLRDDGCFFLNIADSYADKNICLVPSRLALALQAAGWYVRCDIIWSKPNPMPESVTDRPTKSHEYVWMLTKSERYYYDHVAIRESNTQGTIDRLTSGPIHAIKAQGTKAALLCGVGGKEYVVADGRNKRSVWEINTRPCSEAHFAVMPPKLVEPCLLAATSQKGCCGTCGAPWNRVTKPIREHGLAEASYPKTDGLDAQNGHKRLHMRLKAARAAGEAHDNALGGKETIGWEATCKCADATIQPCRCLDPFGGSGTVGLVAAEHGRDCTLIDLVPHNMEIIAVNRLKRVQPRLALEA